MKNVADTGHIKYAEEKSNRESFATFYPIYIPDGGVPPYRTVANSLLRTLYAILKSKL